ncbi:asparaginase [Hutsoniella sourekii]
MKKIAFLSTGGTIAMQEEASGLATNQLTSKDLLAKANLHDQEIEFIEIDYKNIASPHVLPVNVIEIKELIEEAYRVHGIDGAVITHGTDTLQETAYLLDITMDLDIPVVVTGAQRNSSLPSSDVAANIIDSVLVAASPAAKGLGVLVVFASDIIPGREAVKTHTSRVDTFKAPEFGPIGTVSNNRVIIQRKPLLRDHYQVGKDFAKQDVCIIPTYQGQDARPFYHAIQDQVSGIIIEGVGAGHVTERMVEGVEAALEAGIVLVICSRVGHGRLFESTYGYYGSESHLRQLGVILGEDLSADKLRLKLMVLLSNQLTHEQIREEFEKDHYRS